MPYLILAVEQKDLPPEHSLHRHRHHLHLHLHLRLHLELDLSLVFGFISSSSSSFSSLSSSLSLLSRLISQLEIFIIIALAVSSQVKLQGPGRKLRTSDLSD
ncbi:hypothetical protein TWF696_001321 [Orbilia brochopaga]|uniref:Uncharacterized protein n=1 Tax=Orbilia brochopaga TaxID=3140254 RepID=A0AAV9U8A2_9PEZI